jgi:DNA-binding transcriptional regulator GbsR (MarR family)
MHNNFQERIIAILRGSPNGLTSNEITELLGPTAKNMSSRLSKLAAYGIIGKVRHSCGPASVYRALPYEKSAAWPAPSGLNAKW